MNLISATVTVLPAPTRSERMKQLREALRSLALEQALELVDAAGRVATLAEEIVAGAPAYPPGVVEQARHIAEATRVSLLTFQSLLDRHA